MHRHQLDPLALAAGLIFLIVVAVIAVGGAQLLTATGVLPVILVLLGVTGLISGWLSRRRTTVSHDGRPTLGERAAAGRRDQQDHS